MDISSFRTDCNPVASSLMGMMQFTPAEQICTQSLEGSEPESDAYGSAYAKRCVRACLCASAAALSASAISARAC